MKKYFLYLFLLMGGASITGCSYLDIVPDERATEEDTYKDKNAAMGFLYSCYGYMPQPNYTQGSLDLMTGDEVVTAFEHEPFANFPKGNFTAANPVLSYWNTLYGGIRQCYKFSKKIDLVPGLTAEEKDEFRAELNFLVGYYHMLLMRCYGPIIIVQDEVDVNTNPQDYLGRSSLQATVDFITSQFDKAIASANLPSKRESVETGRATKTAAYALKAYTLMYYASPLFNGNAKLSEALRNIDGSELISPTFDKKRWEVARDAYKKAIDAAEAEGFSLFNISMHDFDNKFPENQTLRTLRGNMVTKVRYNKEEIWTMNADEGPYGLQKKTMPYVSNQNFCGVSPTLAMLRRFYTKNGLPYNVDPETKDLNEFNTVNLNEENSIIEFADGSEAIIAKAGKKTSQMNMNREPRYYAWVAFHSGYFELNNAGFNPAYKSEEMEDNKQLIADFTKNGNCGRKGRNNDYPPTGFLNKKGIHPDNTCGTNSVTLNKYPWPLVRLAELYLGYAECLAECGDATGAKQALDPIRERAGIPTVDDSWALVGKTPNAKEMVEIVRQERMIELYLENQNFWDMRRWLKADKYFDVKAHGLNIDAVNFEEFSQEVEVPFLRSFQPHHWLLPIPADDFNNNHNIVQNPGY